MNVLIVDDERLARQDLKKILSEFSDVEVVGECSNAEEAKEMIEKEKPDLVLLDIQMPEKTGFELLEELDFIPHVIFITAFNEYAVNAFKINALDYLLKPVETERLDLALDRLRNLIKSKPASTSSDEGKLGADHQIFIKDGEKCWFVALSQVRYFESYGNYVKVFFEDQKPLILKSLNSLEDKLDPKLFFRANRKHLINLKWINSIESWFNGGLKITMKDEVEIEISRRQSSKFKDLMSL